MRTPHCFRLYMRALRLPDLSRAAASRYERSLFQTIGMRGAHRVWLLELSAARGREPRVLITMFSPPVRPPLQRRCCYRWSEYAHVRVRHILRYTMTAMSPGRAPPPFRRARAEYAQSFLLLDPRLPYQTGGIASSPDASYHLFATRRKESLRQAGC